MIDDFYQAALAALRHHLDEAGAAYSIDDGEIVLDGHRLGLSISFEGFVPQGEHTLAPLDIQIHLDGDSGDRFRVGTLGVGPDPGSAMHAAIAEWHLLAAAPLLAALGAPVETRRDQRRPPLTLAGWELFAGRAGIRGRVPPELRADGHLVRALLERLRQIVSRWNKNQRFELHAIYFMASCEIACEIQAAVDGIVHGELAELLQGLAWPVGGEAYLYKQLFVFRWAQPD